MVTSARPLVGKDIGPTIIEWEGKPVVQTKSNLNTDATSKILDTTWAKNAFLVNEIDLVRSDLRNRAFSSAYFKFTDTSLGGSLCINPKPQFTRYADTREPGRLHGREETTIGATHGKHGLGRYYSEAIEDTSQIISMRFGVPQFNSLTTFFTGFYNADAAALAKTGRTSNFFSSLGFAAGLVASVYVWPIVTTIMLGRVFRFLFNKQTSKFYYLKPTMITYWSAVNTMVNKIGINRGLLPMYLKNPNDQKVGTAYSIDETQLKNLHNLMPDIFAEDGRYDIYNVANKAQRVATKLQSDVYDDFNSGSYDNYYGFVEKSSSGKLTQPEGKHDFFNRMQHWLTGELTKPDVKIAENVEPNATRTPDDTLKNTPVPVNHAAFLNAEFNDGSAFACFRVDYTGPVSEQFSNAVGESDLAAKINSVSSQARAANFSFAGGNMIGGAVGAVVNSVTDAVKSFVSGGLEAVGFSGLAALAGAAFVDIPKNWQSSSAQLPRSSYTIELRSPYGNVISQMNNLYIPLCMLLAGALPLSTGKQSYASPFILELFDKGRCQTRLGMIDSLQITRGTGNLGFNKSGNAMGIDITFSIIDMSSVMHMPIAQGYLNGPDNEGIFDDETVFNDYMCVLASQGLYEQLYTWPKLKLRIANKIRSIQALSSAGYWASIVHEKTPVGLLDVFYKGSSIIPRNG